MSKQTKPNEEVVDLNCGMRSPTEQERLSSITTLFQCNFFKEQQHRNYPRLYDFESSSSDFV